MKILFLWPDRLRLDLGGPKIVLELAAAMRKVGWETILYDPWTLPDGFNETTPWSERCRKFLHVHASEFDVVDYDHGRLPFPRSEFSDATLMVARSGLLGYHFLKIKIPDLYPIGDPIRRLIKGKGRHERHQDNHRLAHITCQEADLINVANDDDKRELISHGLAPEKIQVFPFGIDESRRSLFERVSSEIPSAVRIAFVGSFDARKGAREFPEIVRQITRRIPGSKICLFGTKGRFPTAQEVYRFFPSSLRDRLEIVAEYQPNDLPRLLSSCTLGIFPSYIEGFPFGVLEMLAASLPVIAYNSPGAPMMIPAEFLVLPGDVNAMACMVENLVGDRAKLLRARQLAKTRSAQFTWNKTTELTVSCYIERLRLRRSASTPLEANRGIIGNVSTSSRLLSPMDRLLQRPLIICGFPKSGNTWLGLILSYYYGIPYLDAHDHLNEEARFHYATKEGGHPRWPEKPKRQQDSIAWTSVIKSHQHLSQLNQAPFLDWNKVIELNQTPILILREPKDVAVSYYYYNYFHVPILQGYRLNRISIYLRLIMRKIFYFDRFVLNVASQWRDFHRLWMKSRCHVVRYEDLIRDSFGTVGALLRSTDGEVDEEALKAAVDYCRFDNLRRLEARQVRYHSRDQYFFRAGENGRWTRYFGRKTQKRFDETLAETYGGMGWQSQAIPSEVGANC